MVEFDKLQGNAVPVIIFILIVGIVFSLIASFGVPFIAGADTYEASEVISVHETDNEVIFELDEDGIENEVVVMADGDEIPWEDGKATVSRDLNNIVVETYPEGEGLYDIHEYEEDRLQMTIDRPEVVLAGQDVTYSLQSMASPSDYQDTRWFVEEELQQSGGTNFGHTFDETGEFEIEAQTVVDDITYTRTEDIEVFEPDEIVLETNITQTDVSVLESFDLTVEELTEQGIQNVDIDWGDGEETVASINDSVRYWYDEPGEYNITITAEDTDTGSVTEETISMNVGERDHDDQEVNIVNINVFDEDQQPISNATVTMEAQEETTDTQGLAQFRVLPGEYNVTASQDGFETESEEIFVVEDLRVDMSLDRITITEVDEPDDDNGIISNESLLDFEELDEEDIDEEELEQIREQGLLPNVLESMEGNGTPNDPYQISTYLELQAATVQPNSYYELVNNINAGLSQSQDIVNEVEDADLGDASQEFFELRMVQSKPEEINVEINGQEIDENQYTINRPGQDDPTIDSDRIYLVFIDEDEGQVSPSEMIDDVNAVDSVIASYDIPSPGGVARGFEPIESAGGTVNLDGNNHQIENLMINRPFEDNIGLYNQAVGGSVTNTQISADVTGEDNVGVILGRSDNVDIDQVSVGGSVEGTDSVGGMAGEALGTTISQSSSFTSTTGEEEVGGLVGSGIGDVTVSETAVQLLSVGGSISGSQDVGGVAGYLDSGEIQDVYTRASYTTRDEVSERFGGISGTVGSNTEVENVYTVSPQVETPNTDDSELIVSGNIAGVSEGDITNAYWDDTESANEFETGIGALEDGETDGVEALTTSQMQGSFAEDNMNGFNYDEVWESIPDDYPELISSTLQTNDPRVIIQTPDTGENIHDGTEPPFEFNVEVDVENFDLVPDQDTDAEEGEGQVYITIGDAWGAGTEIGVDEDEVFHYADGTSQGVVELEEEGETIALTAQLGTNNNTATQYSETIFINAVDSGDGTDEEDEEDEDDSGDGENGEGGSDDVPTVSLDVDSDSYEVIDITPDEMEDEILQDGQVGDLDPAFYLEPDTRYRIDIDSFMLEEHPVEILDVNDNPLLSMATDGEFEDDEDVDYEISGTSIEFTATEEFISRASTYQSANNEEVGGPIFRVGELRSLTVEAVDENGDRIDGADIQVVQDGEVVSEEIDSNGILNDQFVGGEYEIQASAEDRRDQWMIYELNEPDLVELKLIPEDMVLIEWSSEGDESYIIEDVMPSQKEFDIIQEGEETSNSGDNSGATLLQSEAYNSQSELLHHEGGHTVDNPTLVLEEGTRYRFVLDDMYDQHPIEIVDEDGNRLLSAEDVNGEMEDNPLIDWQELPEHGAVEFTVTGQLTDEATGYQCAVHTESMNGGIIFE